MAFNYPYGDTQQLNLDWIITKLKELEASGAGNVDLEKVSKALIALKYNPGTSYVRYDYAFYNGKLYRCLSSTSGAFDPAAWQESLIGDDVAILTRLINAIDAAAVMDVKFNTSGTNGKIQQKYNDTYHDVVEVDYTPVQNSKRPLSSNAGYELNGAITALQGDIASVETSNTASKNYYINDLVVLNGELKRVTSQINTGQTFTSSNTTSITLEEQILNATYITASRNTSFTSLGNIYGYRLGRVLFLMGYIKISTVPTSASDILVSGLPKFTNNQTIMLYDQDNNTFCALYAQSQSNDITLGDYSLSGRSGHILNFIGAYIVAKNP